MKRLYNFFKRPNSFKRDKKINQIFYTCPIFIDDLEYYSTITRFNINDVTSRVHNNTTEIKVVSERPGMLIGKAGKTLNELRNYLESELHKPVKIIIEESTLWQFYKY